MEVKDKKELSLWDFDGLSPEELYDQLKIKTEGLQNPIISFESYEYDSGIECYIIFEREETAAEEARRKKKEDNLKKLLAKEADRKTQKELRELERLKKKYEST